MRAPAVERSEAEHELPELERLREVVVGAELEPGRLVVEPVGGGEHEDRHAAAGGDDALGDLVAGSVRDVPVEDGDVVGVDAQQLDSGCRRQLRCPPRSLPGAGRRGSPPPCNGSSSTINTRMLDATSWCIVGISRTVTVPEHTRSLIGGDDLQTGSNKSPVADRLRPLVIAALAAAAVASSSSSRSTPWHARVPVCRACPARCWPCLWTGRRSSKSGQSRIHAGPNQHAAAIASVAKVMTAYIVLRDHPLRLGEDGPAITLTEPMSPTPTGGARRRSRS